MWIDAVVDSATGEAKDEIAAEYKEKIEFYPDFVSKDSSTKFRQMIYFRKRKMCLNHVNFQFHDVESFGCWSKLERADK